MNDIVVGVKPVKNSALAEVDADADAAIGAYWVTIDGQEVPCGGGAGNLIKVTLEMDEGPCVAHVAIIGSSLRTVRWDDPDEAPDRWKRKEEDAD